ncbi:MAG: putative transcriptional regulator, LuxR family, putative sensory transduction protein liaR [Acidimicrobiales bacterium]|nr:putative transcriptional regulator, LuxR family, putative sensory transduction protein liaR [Acidimicrobiales bacterium]
MGGAAERSVPESIRLAIVDDHPVVLEAFSNLFELVDGLEVVLTAGDADEAMAGLAEVAVDVAVVDFGLPGADGAVLAGKIKATYPGVRVLIFTASMDPADVRRAAGSAADGILLKSIPLDYLVAAIRDVAAGRRVVGRDLSGLLESVPDAPATAQRLSGRELEVLALLARGMSNKDAGRELFISQATVKSHVENILRKLGASDRAGAVAEGFRRKLIA